MGDVEDWSCTQGRLGERRMDDTGIRIYRIIRIAEFLIDDEEGISDEARALWADADTTARFWRAGSVSVLLAGGRVVVVFGRGSGF